jgi:phage shock protein PspC (stress-responsive transcriptional regulator)
MDTPTNLLTPETPSPSGPPPVRRLTRRTDEKVIAGVAAGLGEYFNVDPILFRVGFIVLALLGGAGVLIYALGWWLLPAVNGPSDGSSEASRAPHRMRNAGEWFGIALLTVGAVLLLSGAGHHTIAWGFGRGIVWGAALILLGILVYRNTGERRSPSVTQTSPRQPDIETENPVTVDAGGSPEAPTAAFAPPAQGAGPPAHAKASEVRPARRRRERSALGWITLGVVLLAVGVGALLDQAGTIALSADRYLALALAVLGAGLLVGTWFGRARWLIVFGILLIPFVLAASLITVPLTGGSGDRLYRPLSVTDIRSEYHMTAGRLHLDLRGVDFAGQPTTIAATVGFGALVVDVPSDATVTVHGKAGAGDVRIQNPPFGPADHQVDGIHAQLDQTFGPADGSAVIVLNLQVGFGQISVWRSNQVPILG